MGAQHQAARRFAEPPPPLTAPWTLGDLRAHWPTLVGPQLGDVTFPNGIDERGVLTVSVDTPAWLRELVNGSFRVVALLPPVIGTVAVKRIRFVAQSARVP
jgi:predicted nucleic acid-binding Zn ribbon protein